MKVVCNIGMGGASRARNIKELIKGIMEDNWTTQITIESSNNMNGKGIN